MSPGNNCIRTLSFAEDGSVQVGTLCGGGLSGRQGGFDDGNQVNRPSLFRHPTGLACAPGPWLYVADTDNHAIRRVHLGKNYGVCFVCMYACLYMCMHVCLYLHVCMFLCFYVCICVCVCIRVYVCMYVCRYACGFSEAQCDG